MNRWIGLVFVAGGALAALWLLMRRNSPAAGGTATGDFGSLGQIGSNISQDSTPAVVGSVLDFAQRVNSAATCWRRFSTDGGVGNDVLWLNRAGDQMRLPHGISPANDCALID